MGSLTCINSILDVSASEWNALLDTDQPFIQHEFLSALEISGSACQKTGWQPYHALLHDEYDQLIAAAPLYSKTHSYGEFVFDFVWANAYHQLGRSYYPKLVNAIPFTPIAGPRLLARDDNARQQLARALTTLPHQHGFSSLHSLFLRTKDLNTLQKQKTHTRRGIQYLWFNRGYESFEDFLNMLSAKRRKEIRRERRRIQNAGVQVLVYTPDQIPANLWPTLYAFYSRTYAVRSQAPYLTPDFFHELARQLNSQTRFFIAWHDNRPVGMAFMMVSHDTLYGRHWGCEDDYHSLHFETCYYAGIDYCIEHGLPCFDAGAQGEHKIRRGFEPLPTWSSHIIHDHDLDRPIGEFVQQEAQMMSDYEHQQRQRCDFGHIDEQLATKSPNQG